MKIEVEIKELLSLIKDSVERERVECSVPVPIEGDDVAIDKTYKAAYVRGWRNGFGQGGEAVIRRISSAGNSSIIFLLPPFYPFDVVYMLRCTAPSIL
ncbi:unnamed protein product [marine sediment metagenome]|uniref:Uncharacterized protein n=1 Tax=marine sediment metagenome TaxID=412755 RepID=X1JMH5_9ZZZZ